MNKILYFLFLGQFAAYQINSKETGCSISTNEDLGNPHPLLLKPNGKDHDPFFLPEDTNGKISFDTGDEIHLSCPGANITVNSTAQNFSIASAFCDSDTKFRINNSTSSIPFSQISCTDHAEHVARYNGNTCLSKHKEFQIGFDLEARFLQHIVGCFDPVNQITLYTWYNLSSTIGGSQTGVARPSFTQGSFYNVGSFDVNTLYLQSLQRRTINRLLGLSNASTKYIQNNNYYLARGHLTAKTDFVYGAQQRLTFYFVNAAPQWQTFNAGNWETLESNVRDYASERGLDLIVYTGTYGIATLPHEETGEDTELYLYVVTSDANKALPVPQIFWKFVYEPISKAGAVFVGINNPYQNETKKLCTDRTEEFDWLTWKPNDQAKGFSYTCTYADFKKVVNYLPDVEVNSLLPSFSSCCSKVRLGPIHVLCLLSLLSFYTII